jgi:hypothetical protein
MTVSRRLAGILAADVAGYSRLIGADEGGTVKGFKAIKAERRCQVNLSRSEKPKQGTRSHCRHCIPPFARRFGPNDPQR